MDRIRLNKNSKSFQGEIALASSKSESNRALIINALCGFKGEILNLSSARDTQTMNRLLKEDGEVADVLDAGTTMRFLTAYFAAIGEKKLLTGTQRMQERPIGILVDALRTIGVEIDYQKEDGYPPHMIQSFDYQLTDEVSIRGDVSSQYISALLMVAPTLPKGLKIHLSGEVGSIPYITMTIQLMASFGVKVQANWENQTLLVEAQNYVPSTFSVESDWSGASYWYSIVALAKYDDFTIELLGLKENSLQGDRAIVAIMQDLGVSSTFTKKGVLLKKKTNKSSFSWDFSNCPDLTQTVAVICVAKKIKAEFTGIESLKIKETDRVLALQNELAKIGGALTEIEKNERYVLSSALSAFENCEPQFKSYEDHRMAMAFAPLAMLMNVVIEDPNVVVKSYPEYWEHLGKVIDLK